MTRSDGARGDEKPKAETPKAEMRELAIDAVPAGWTSGHWLAECERMAAATLPELAEKKAEWTRRAEAVRNKSEC